jgi:ubiquinone/menaquinone biosynthesis C-methylase UbiE
MAYRDQRSAHTTTAKFRSVAREHWERQGSNWAAWARTPDFDAYWKYSSKFFDLLPEPHGRTLEVGCGEGRVTRDLAGRGHRVTAVDVTAELLELAHDADRHGQYVRCDAAALPFMDESFDLTVFYNSLMDVDDMESSVREAARVLKPHGHICACVTHPIADAGQFDADGRFQIAGTYLGPRRWLELPTVQDGLTMNFSGWAYPLEAYFKALEDAGLKVEALREPAGEEGWNRIPMFLMWRAVKI